MSFSHWGPQSWTQGSRWGLIRAEGQNPLPPLLPTQQPRTRLAFWAMAGSCWASWLSTMSSPSPQENAALKCWLWCSACNTGQSLVVKIIPVIYLLFSTKHMCSVLRKKWIQNRKCDHLFFITFIRARDAYEDCEKANIQWRETVCQSAHSVSAENSLWRLTSPSHKDFVFRTWSNSEASINEMVRSTLWVQFPYGNFHEV